MSFELGTKVEYLGGDHCTLAEEGQVGAVLEVSAVWADEFPDEECTVVQFDVFPWEQTILTTCLKEAK